MTASRATTRTKPYCTYPWKRTSRAVQVHPSAKAKPGSLHFRIEIVIIPQNEEKNIMNRHEEEEEDDVVAVAYIGEGVGDRQLSKVKKMKFIYQNFEDMPQKRGEKVISPIVNCHGYQWRLWMYPRGGNDSNEETEHISLFLELVQKANGIVPAKYSVHISKFNKRASKVLSFGPKNSEWGFNDFISRQRALGFSKACINGNLIVEVGLQAVTQRFLPSNPYISDMLKLLGEAKHDDTSDVTFEVGKGPATNSKTGKECFHAHRNILKLRAPTLGSLTEGCASGTPIPMEDVDPDTFRQVLEHIYTGEIPCNEFLAKDAQSLVRLGDRFGCIRLKLAAESYLASEGFRIENVADLILFADGHNCSLLKESAIEYFVEHSVNVMRSKGFGKIQESTIIMTELMTAIAESTKDRAERYTTKSRRVATVLQELDDKGLDLDGPYETLVQRLENSNDNEVGAGKNV